MQESPIEKNQTSENFNLAQLLEQRPQLLAAILVGLFVVLLAISSLTFFFGYPYTKTILAFPTAKHGSYYTELRTIPRFVHGEDAAQWVVREYLLGPINLTQRNTFLVGLKLNSLLLRRGQLYIDLQADSDSSKSTLFSPSIEGLRRSIQLGFPLVRTIHISVNGHELGKDIVKK